MRIFTQTLWLTAALLSRTWPSLCGVMFLALMWLGVPGAQAQTTTYMLGTAALLVGPAGGTNSVVLAVTPSTGAWSATTNATWLHLSPANQSGTGSTNVIFSYDANAGATRTGTLTIGGQTLTVTQAGSTYVAAGQITTLVSELSVPFSLAVDAADNLYVDDQETAIQKWTATTGNLSTVVTHLGDPMGLAVDSAGNLYVADTLGNLIRQWTVANSNLTTLVATTLNNPTGVAVDAAGNVYIADTDNNAIKKWSAANSNLTTLISSGLVYPGALAVDCAGNVYINDGVILKFVAANNTVVKLVPQSQNPPGGIAVDGSGNVYFNYIAPQGGAVDTYVWTMAASNVTTVASLSASRYDVPAVAVDAARNLFISDSVQGVIDELPCVFVDPTPISESAAAGDDVLPTVLPVTANLLAPFAPGSDQSWLAITGITNGVASFSFAANTGPARTAHITLLGQSIPITQEGAPTPPLLTGVVLLSNGVIQFGFTNNSTASFTVLTTTNLSWPLSEWSVAGTPINTAPGIFQFTSQPTTNDAQRFYCVPSQQQSCEFIHRVRSSGKPRNGCCRM